LIRRNHSGALFPIFRQHVEGMFTLMELFRSRLPVVDTTLAIKLRITMGTIIGTRRVNQTHGFNLTLTRAKFRRLITQLSRMEEAGIYWNGH
jgi:hypothetical protein